MLNIINQYIPNFQLDREIYKISYSQWCSSEPKKFFVQKNETFPIFKNRFAKFLLDNNVVDNVIGYFHSRKFNQLAQEVFKSKVFYW